MLYISYGMNTNVEQMANRCPDSISIGRVDIPDHRLVFRGVADIEESYGDFLQAVLWDITPDCELALDMLEGYPHYYTKKYIDVTVGRKTYQAMVYYMVGDRTDYSYPSRGYQQMLEEGYQAHGLDLEQIYNAPGFDNYGDPYDWVNSRYSTYRY